MTLFEQALDSLVRLLAASLHTHLEVVPVTLFEQALDSLVRFLAASLHTHLEVVPVTLFEQALLPAGLALDSLCYIRIMRSFSVTVFKF